MKSKFDITRSQLQYARLKIQVLEEHLRLRRIAKYGPGSEKLSDLQLQLLEEEPGASREDVAAESQREELPSVRGEQERVSRHPVESHSRCFFNNRSCCGLVSEITSIYAGIRNFSDSCSGLRYHFRRRVSLKSMPPSKSVSSSWLSTSFVTEVSAVGASETFRRPIFYSSLQNANASIAPTHLVRITHPFHPFNGRQLACVGERYNRYGMRLLLQVDDESVCSVPPQWTEVVAPDPEIVIGEQRALFRVVDLLELTRLVDRLKGHHLPER